MVMLAEAAREEAERDRGPRGPLGEEGDYGEGASEDAGRQMSGTGVELLQAAQLARLQTASTRDDLRPCARDLE